MAARRAAPSGRAHGRASLAFGGRRRRVRGLRPSLGGSRRRLAGSVRSTRRWARRAALGRVAVAVPAPAPGSRARPCRHGLRPPGRDARRACRWPRRWPRQPAWRTARPWRRRPRPSSAARAENSRTVGWRARPGRRPRRGSTRGWRSRSPAELPPDRGRPLAAPPASDARVRCPVVQRLSSAVGPRWVLGCCSSVMACGLLGRWCTYILARTGDGHLPASAHSSDSGSTSTDQGASTPPSSRPTGSSPRSTTLKRQRSARRAM